MPQAYQWDYEHTDCDSNPLYDTFSVPVFQWIPKASGKGLKKSKTIRVNGYTADPQRAYDRAAELCRQLNEAGVRLDNPPKWLQKTYSVPGPVDYVKERKSDAMPLGRMRGIRERVAKQRLGPAGFIKSTDATFVRRRGEQIHAVCYDAHSGAIRILLGVHFTFAPPCSHRRAIPLDEFHHLDCAGRAGIGSFLPKHESWGFEYGSDPDALEATLTSATNIALSVLDRFGKQWEHLSAALAEVESGAYEPWDFRSNSDIVASCILTRMGRLQEADARLDALRAKDPKDWHDQPMALTLDTTRSIDWIEPPSSAKG